MGFAILFFQLFYKLGTYKNKKLKGKVSRHPPPSKPGQTLWHQTPFINADRQSHSPPGSHS